MENKLKEMVQFDAQAAEGSGAKEEVLGIDRKSWRELTEKEIKSLSKVPVKFGYREDKNKNRFSDIKIGIHETKMLLTNRDLGKNQVSDTTNTLVMLNNDHEDLLKPYYKALPTRIYKGEHTFEDGGTSPYYRVQILTGTDEPIKFFLSKDNYLLFNKLGLDKKYQIFEEVEKQEDENFNF